MAPAYYFIIFAFILSVLMGFVIIPKILIISHRHQLYDLPNYRKIHNTPIPRLGGVVFFPVVTTTVAFLMGTRYLLGYDIINDEERTVLVECLFLLCSSFILYIIGVKDDLVGVSYKWKLIAQILCGIALALAGLWINDGNGLLGIHHINAFLGIPLSILIVVYLINAFNMIDGLDGLASGLASVTLITTAIIFIQEKQLIYALMCFSALGVILPFSIYNVFGSRMKGKKIFMGDTGSLTLGIIISFLLLKVWIIDTERTGSPYNSLIVFSTMIIPLSDVLRVFFFRVIHHRNPFLPDKNHIHHRLLRIGMNDKGVTLSIITCSIFIDFLNIWLRQSLDINYVLGVNVFIMIIINAIINSIIKKKETHYRKR